MTENKKTLGQIALDLQEKELLETAPQSVNELAQNMMYGKADDVSEGMSLSYLERVWQEACDAFKVFGTNYCFVEVRHKSTGRLGHNTTDKLFIGRQTCPSPNYSQDAFRVTNDGAIDYLWSVPSKLDVHIVFSERHSLILDPEYSALTKMVIDFKDGSLLSMARDFDKEYDGIQKGIA